MGPTTFSKDETAALDEQQIKAFLVEATEGPGRQMLLVPADTMHRAYEQWYLDQMQSGRIQPDEHGRWMWRLIGRTTFGRLMNNHVTRLRTRKGIQYYGVVPKVWPEDKIEDES